MRKNQGLIQFCRLTVILFGVLSVLSCDKTPVHQGDDDGDASKTSNRLEVDLTLSPGILTTEGPVCTPSGSISISSEDKAANYIVVLSINDGESYTLKGMWDGRTRVLDSYLESCREYGEYIVKGRVYNSAEPSDAIEFSESVWMKYEPAEIEATRWFVISSSGSEPQGAFEEKDRFSIGETGRLIINYAPKTSKLFFAVEDEKALFSFSEISNNDGTCVLRYIVEKAGYTELRLVANNGDDRSVISSEIVVEAQDNAAGDQ